jgi:hypothetical protein
MRGNANSAARIDFGGRYRVTLRMIAVLMVVLGHAGLIAVMKLDGVPLRRLAPEYTPITAELLASDYGSIPTRALSFDLPQPTIDISPPELPSGALPAPEVEAPRIDSTVRVDSGPFAQRARLSAGTVAAVSLLLEIAADGSVISARVVRSDCNALVDLAAIDYARATHWTAGSIDGVPHAMQATLTVILGENNGADLVSALPPG